MAFQAQMTHVADQALLFDLPAVPKRQRSKWEELGEMADKSNEVGGLIPQIAAAVLLDVSRQRVHQLLADGTLTAYEFFGQRYLSALEVRKFIEVKREPGRPWNSPSARELWRRSKEVAKNKG